MNGTRPEAAQILVVEDEAAIRQLLRTTLEAEGHVVHEARDAREGRTLAGTAASTCTWWIWVCRMPTG